MTKTAGLDLAALSTQAACEKGFELELKHPVTKAPLGVFITVLGKDSHTFRNFTRERGNAMIRKQVELQRRGKQVEPPTLEQAEKDSIDLLVAVTTGWRTGDEPTVTHDGRALPFNADNVRFLYKESWIRDQVDEAVGDLENFMSS